MKKERYYQNKSNHFKELSQYFMIDKISLENGLLEKREEIYSMYKDNFFVIDRLPKVIESIKWFEPFNIFFNPDNTAEENERYYQTEAIFLKSLTIIAAYSSVWIESSYFYNHQCFGVESLSKEEKEYLLKVQKKRAFKSIPTT